MFLATVLAGAPAAGAGAPGDDDVALARVEAFLEDTTTLQANFRQLLLDDNGQVMSDSQGTMMLMRPGRFRWEYTAPAPLLVLGDGSRIWNYDADLENATVVDQDDALSGNPSVLLSGSGKVGEAFRVGGSWAAEEIDWVELLPLRDEGDFRAVRLGFTGTSLKLMELHDMLGQTTRIEFSDIAHNPRLDDTLFVFVPPAGTDVIGAGVEQP